MKGKRKQRTATTPRLRSDHSLCHDRNLELGFTSITQDTKRNNVFNGPQPFNVNESDPDPSCKRTKSSQVIDDSIQTSDTIEHMDSDDTTEEGES